VSVTSNGEQANSASPSPAVSADGRIVAFRSFATNLDPRCANGKSQIYVRDRGRGTTTCVSISTDGVAGDADSDLPSVSANGFVVAFTSLASNLDVGDTNGLADIFIHHRFGGSYGGGSYGQTWRITNSTPPPAPGGATAPVVSGDGRFVAYVAWAPDVAYGSHDVYVYDDAEGEKTTTRVNVALDGGRGNGTSGGYFEAGPIGCCGDVIFRPGISDDGRFVAFLSDASDLVPNDTNQSPDVFVRDRLNGSTSRVSVDENGGQIGGESYGSARSTPFPPSSPWTPIFAMTCTYTIGSARRRSPASATAV
jgi:Tol biopolymer transport system component